MIFPKFRGARKALEASRRPKMLRASHNLVEFATGGPSKAVDSLLSNLPIERRRAESERTVAECVDDGTIGIVLICGQPNMHIESALRRLTYRYIPRWVVVSGIVDRDTALRLYRAGATTVFSWPRDGLVFQKVMGEHLWPSGTPVPENSNQAIGDAVRARIQLLSFDTSSIQIDCRDGNVFLSGTIAKKQYSDSVASQACQVSGVRRVHTSALLVTEKVRTDECVHRDVQHHLEQSASVDAATLSMSVRRGCVTLAGTLRGADELKRVLSLVSKIEGVRSIANMTTVSPRQKVVDKRIATRLQKALSDRFPRSELNISVFGGCAVVDGLAPKSNIKRRIERFVGSIGSFQHVVNRVEVASGVSA